MSDSRRIVVKIGTSTLTHDTGRVNLERIDMLARTLSDLQNRGNQIIMVTSGAISVGVEALGLGGRPDLLREKQAAAAVGQCRLMHLYDKSFAEYGHTVSQILLNRSDVEDAERKHNLLEAFNALLEWGVIPIVNENDSVAPNEIEEEHTKVFGDNDTLSAVVAELVDADLLVLLSDIEGLYTGDPRHDPSAFLIPVVTELTEKIMKASGGAGSARGTGGMLTKLAAAQIALDKGFPMYIAHGRDPRILYDIADGKTVGTLFRR